MAVDAHTADTELAKLGEPACDEPHTEVAHVDDIDDGHTENDDDIDDDVDPRTGVRLAVLVAVAVVAALTGLVAWLGFRAYESDQAQQQRQLYVQVARQRALNLTTIDYTKADADVQRILDSSTVAFRDDFRKRLAPFIEVLKQAQIKSEGASNPVWSPWTVTRRRCSSRSTSRHLMPELPSRRHGPGGCELACKKSGMPSKWRKWRLCHEAVVAAATASPRKG